MKNLKKCCKELIEKQFKIKRATNKRDGINAPLTVNFKDVYEELFDVLSSYMRTILSVSIAFYGILHLCNEDGYTLEKAGADTTAFLIRESNSK